MPPPQSPDAAPPQPGGPKNLPPPTEPGGADPSNSYIPKSQTLPLPSAEPSAGSPVVNTQAQDPHVEVPAQAPQPDVKVVVPPTADPSDPEQRQGQPDPGGQNQETTAEEARNQLKQAIEQSNEVLINAQTFNPFFADILTVDRAKVTIAKRTFFRTAEVMSMRVEDLLNVTANVGLFFGIVYISNRVAGGDEPTSIGPFWRKDAVNIKRITQGYVIALQRSIDVTNLSCDELKKMLEKLGEDEHPDPKAAQDVV